MSIKHIPADNHHVLLRQVIFLNIQLRLFVDVELCCCGFSQLGKVQERACEYASNVTGCCVMDVKYSASDWSWDGTGLYDHHLELWLSWDQRSTNECVCIVFNPRFRPGEALLRIKLKAIGCVMKRPCVIQLIFGEPKLRNRIRWDSLKDFECTCCCVVG